ncbi:EamA family transporter RarD [Stakelama tenebrarum]|uniref:EamA family transporter RarD n=1 Tax=Stakelama tenebrarum TaxID=2711215 RepID=A0A6G6Y4D6_9SPHN|nr:EamA family transporter RarD [Sphingosinithalassobacter tenebrarum]QIG79814.1 EamA family transporter RarD [Sphingosinithalassobacter tenebrarum]
MNAASSSAPAAQPPDRTGLAQGVGAYLIWGALPVYFAALAGPRADEIVAHRILWSLVLLAGVIAVMRRGAALVSALRNPRALGMLAGSATLISVNWLTYILAVQNGHVLAASLGYFLNPLVNVVIGVVLLGERLTRVQTAAVGLAAIGVLVLAAGAGTTLWISLVLALSFAFYGLIRKLAPVESVEGLTIETLLLAPFAGGFLLWLGPVNDFGGDMGISLLLAASGIVTATPLLLFAAAARRLPYSTLGLLQYIAPTGQFLLAVFFFREAMTPAHIVCFAFIWTGLALYGAHGGVTARAARRRARASGV